jgi:hypothetical protein
MIPVGEVWGQLVEARFEVGLCIDERRDRRGEDEKEKEGEGGCDRCTQSKGLGRQR